MLAELFKELGWRNPFTPLLQKIEPEELAYEVVVEGDISHKHRFEYAKWDWKRLGPSIVDLDKDPGGPLAFPMGTFKELHRCSCGREVVTITRSLI